MNSINIGNETKNLFSKIEDLIKTKLSGKYLSWIKKKYYRMKINSNYKHDKNIYLNHSFGLADKYTYENLRGKITLHYHSIEKGMSIDNLRLGFGKRAFSDLFYSMDQYVAKDFPNDDERFLNAINIIGAYIDYHEERNYDVSHIKENYLKYLKYGEKDNEINKPNRMFTKESILEQVNSPFTEFAKSRISVRNYSNEPVERSLIDESIEVAMHTPSVCNRQPWNVYVVQNYKKIQEILNIQQGLNKDERENIKTLLAITVDVSYYANDKERNEAYVDGGLFSMSLLYALHHKGLAACALNANQSNKGLMEELEILEARESEKIILFISVGHYKENFKVPLSDRDDKKYHIKYIK